MDEAMHALIAPKGVAITSPVSPQAITARVASRHMQGRDHDPFSAASVASTVKSKATERLDVDDLTPRAKGALVVLTRCGDDVQNCHRHHHRHQHHRRHHHRHHQYMYPFRQGQVIR